MQWYQELSYLKPIISPTRHPQTPNNPFKYLTSTSKPHQHQ
jgi:hypothetical protein